MPATERRVTPGLQKTVIFETTLHPLIPHSGVRCRRRLRRSVGRFPHSFKTTTDEKPVVALNL
jgi:hypothetical protein